jgi:hypothetical protein
VLLSVLHGAAVGASVRVFGAIEGALVSRAREDAHAVHRRRVVRDDAEPDLPGRVRGQRRRLAGLRRTSRVPRHVLAGRLHHAAHAARAGLVDLVNVDRQPQGADRRLPRTRRRVPRTLPLAVLWPRPVERALSVRVGARRADTGDSRRAHRVVRALAARLVPRRGRRVQEAVLRQLWRRVRHMVRRPARHRAHRHRRLWHVPRARRHRPLHVRQLPRLRRARRAALAVARHQVLCHQRTRPALLGRLVVQLSIRSIVNIYTYTNRGLNDAIFV